MALMTVDLKDKLPLLTLAFVKRGAHIQSGPVLEVLIPAGLSVLQVDKGPTWAPLPASSAW